MPRPDIDILIIGAGVLGLATAAELSARGHAVAVVDPGGANASSLAAGMIAPAFESVAEDCGPQRAAFLRRARDLWPAFAERHGLDLDPGGAVWRGEDAGEVLETLARLGFRARFADGEATTDEDLHIEPQAALAVLAEGLDVRAGRIDRLERVDGRWRAVGGETNIVSTQVVIATGAAAAVDGLPSLASRLIDSITPIRGQIGYAAGFRLDRVVRGREIYIAPSREGVLIGATMEPGRRDLAPDPTAGERLTAAAEALLGHALGAVDWRVGVRGASIDGLPIAGPAGEGVHLALAPRRNGWLLAPLVAHAVADGVEARAPDQDARALSPARFSRA